MLAKNVGNNVHNLATACSKCEWIEENERRTKIIFDDGMEWKSRKPISQATEK